MVEREMRNACGMTVWSHNMERERECTHPNMYNYSYGT